MMRKQTHGSPIKPCFVFLSILTVGLVFFGSPAESGLVIFSSPTDSFYQHQIVLGSKKMPECLEIGNSKNRHRPNPENVDKCLLEYPLSAYLQTMIKLLVGNPLAGSCNIRKGCTPPHNPFNSIIRKFGNDWPPYGYTMVGTERLRNFRAAVHEVIRRGIPGAIMEFGVWRGGAMIMAAAVQQELGTRRDMYLFDAFGPVTNTSYGKSRDFLAVDDSLVEENFRYFELYDPGTVHFVKGNFLDSVQPWYDRSDQIAVLRLDCNFYDSHQEVLYALYENVPVGGIIIFDDIMLDKPVMQSWKDFADDQGIRETLVQIDDRCAWFRKTKSVKVDQSKKRLPVDLLASE